MGEEEGGPPLFSCEASRRNRNWFRTCALNLLIQRVTTHCLPRPFLRPTEGMVLPSLLPVGLIPPFYPLGLRRLFRIPKQTERENFYPLRLFPGLSPVFDCCMLETPQLVSAISPCAATSSFFSLSLSPDSPTLILR